MNPVAYSVSNVGDVRVLHQMVCDEFGIESVEEMLAKDRDPKKVHARHLAAYMDSVYLRPHHSFETIANSLNGRNHATVLHSIKFVMNAMTAPGNDWEDFRNSFHKIKLRLSKFNDMTTSKNRKKYEI